MKYNVLIGESEDRVRLPASPCFQSLFKAKLTIYWLSLHIYWTGMWMVSVFSSNTLQAYFPKMLNYSFKDQKLHTWLRFRKDCGHCY